MKLFGKQRNKKDSSDLKNDYEFVEVEKHVSEESADSSEAEQQYTCKSCGKTFSLSEIKKNMYVCPECGKHDKISARRRNKKAGLSGITAGHQAKDHGDR